MILTQQQIKDIANKCYECKNAQCVKHCPLSNDIPGIMHCIKQGEWQRATQILNTTTLFGAICGLVCPTYRQCEGHCIRGIKHSPVEIGKVESYLAQHSTPNIKAVSNSNKHIAIVGGGASGIACALQLSKYGISSTIYEQNSKLGGIMRYGIPEFRLPKQPLDELDKLLHAVGVKVVTNCTVGKDITMQQLQTQYDSVYVAVGLQQSYSMDIVGDNLDGVVTADSYLKNPIKAQQVVVVGGGNSAIDCARTALRQGSKVTIAYRRTDKEMPAYPQEVQQAVEEGATIKYLVQPIEVLGSSRVEGIKLQQMRLSGVDKDGRASVKPADSYEMLPCDFVIVAIGNCLDTTIQLPTIVEGRVKVDDKLRTDIPCVYAGGDAVNRQNTVVWAVKQGMTAGDSIAVDLGVNI